MENFNIKSLETPEIKSLIDKYSPVLFEVKKRIFRTVILFVISTIAGFLFYEQIIKLLIKFLGLTSVNIVFTSPFQFINLAISCGIASGVVLSFPFLILQILYFLRPALRRKEFKTIIGLLPFSLILFVLGFGFGAYIMKWQIEISLAKSVSLGIGNVLDISNLLTTVILTSALMGIGFQFPVIILLLLKIKVLKPKSLAKQRKWIYLASFIFAILLPPDSILADILLTLPLIILFEVTLLINRFL